MAGKHNRELKAELEACKAAYINRETELNELRTAVYQCEAQNKVKTKCVHVRVRVFGMPFSLRSCLLQMHQAEVNTLRKEFESMQLLTANQIFILSQSAR